MDLGVSLNDLIGGFIDFVGPLFFAVWAFIILSVFLNRRNRLINAFFLWFLLLLFRTGMYLYHVPPFSFLIPEPLNTILFFLTGLILIAIGLIKVSKTRRRIRNARSLNQLIDLSPTEFEKVVAGIYRSQGYKVTHIGKQGDHGVDLIVLSDTGKKLIVQCKKWKGNVGEPLLRDLFGAMHHEEAHAAALFTTGGFTTQAREWSSGKPISLYDGERMVELLAKRKGK